jgi:hypothetical protein
VQGGTRVLLLAFTTFTLLAAISLLVLGGHTDAFFAWTIHTRPNASFLGAAYAAGFVLSVLALRQQSWRQVRVAVVTVTAFTVLTLISTLEHLHGLHLMADPASARTAAWVWLGVYLLIPVAGLTVVVRQQRAQRTPEMSEMPEVRRPLPGWLVAVLAGQGAALTAAGAAMVASGATSHLMTAVQRPGWPWPLTPLGSQAIGAWLLSFGFAIAVALRERDLSRMLVPAVAYAAFGGLQVLVLLYHRTTPGADGLWWWLDLAVLATLVPAGAYGAWASRRPV